jgi:membrane protein implicated in regulation of membrane protease activity
MIVKIRSRLIVGLFFLFLSILAIIIGLILTISIIFAAIGFPIFIAGLFFFIISLFAIIFGAFEDLMKLISFFTFKKYRNKKNNMKSGFSEKEKNFNHGRINNNNIKKDDVIIDVEEKDGVFKTK